MQSSKTIILGIACLMVLSCCVQAQQKAQAIQPSYEYLTEQHSKFESRHGHYQNVSNSKLHYLKFGESKTQVILWLHGTFGSSYDFISYCQQFLALGISSIAVDYYGHGQTKVHDQSVSMYDLADDLRELMIYEGVEKFTVVGVSRGGMAATAFYDEYPHLVNGLVLIDGGSVPWTINVQKLDEKVARDKIGPINLPTDTVFNSRKEAFDYYNHRTDTDGWETFNQLQSRRINEKIVWSMNYGLRDWLWESSTDQIMDGAYRTHTLPAFARSNLLIDPKIVYRNLDVPILIIDPVKKGDWLMDFEQANNELREMHPHLIDHKVYKNTYHNVLYDKPAQLYQDIEVFVNQ